MRRKARYALAPFLNVTFNQPMVPLGTLEQLTAPMCPCTLTPHCPASGSGSARRLSPSSTQEMRASGFPWRPNTSSKCLPERSPPLVASLPKACAGPSRRPPPRVLRSEPSHGPSASRPAALCRLRPANRSRGRTRHRPGYRRRPNLSRCGSPPTKKSRPTRTFDNLFESSGDEPLACLPLRRTVPGRHDRRRQRRPGLRRLQRDRSPPQQVQSYSFRTYAPLRIDRHRCGYYDNAVDCPPLTPFEIVFNNPLDLDAFDESWIGVQPEIPGQVIEVFGTDPSHQRTDRWSHHLHCHRRRSDPGYLRPDAWRGRRTHI